MNKLKYEFRNLNVAAATAISVIFLFVNFSVWCAVGNTAYVFRFISSYVKTMPLWLFGLFDFISSVLLGFALGGGLTEKAPNCQICKYRGAFYFIIGVVCGFLHHGFFFLGARFLAAMLMSLLQCLFLMIAYVNFCRVSTAVSIILAFGFLWRFYLFVLSILTFFWM